MSAHGDPSEPSAALSAIGPTDDPAIEADVPSLRLAAEVARVDKRQLVTGSVRVRTVTRQSEEFVAHDLASEDLEVTRVAFGHEIDSAPSIRQEGEITIIPIVEEILVVEKRLVLKEEVHIRRIHSVETVRTPVVLRRQDAVVEHFEPHSDRKKETDI